MNLYLFLASAKWTASPVTHLLQKPFWIHNYPPISVENTPTSGWMRSSALSPLLGEGKTDTKLPPSPPLFLCRRSAGMVFHLSFLAGTFHYGNASYLFTSRRSVCLWVSFPPLVCQYPSLLIFWAGCMVHLFAQALAWGCGGEHV